MYILLLSPSNSPSTSSPTPKTRLQTNTTTTRKPATTSKLSTRAQHLLDKITLDTMTYGLFELKPIPYAHYMRLYGHRNATQTATQTPHHGHEQDTQTVRPNRACVWTQMPAEFVRSAGPASTAAVTAVHELRNGCGRIDAVAVADAAAAHSIDADAADDNDCAVHMNAALESSVRSLAQLNGLSQRYDWNATATPHQTTINDLQRMAIVLRQADSTISMLSNRRTMSACWQTEQKVQLPFSLGCRRLNVAASGVAKQQMRCTIVDGDVGNSNNAMLIGLHEAGPEDKTLVSVWNSATANACLLLSSWTSVTCLRVDLRRTGVFYGGLTDG